MKILRTLNTIKLSNLGMIGIEEKEVLHKTIQNKIFNVSK